MSMKIELTAMSSGLCFLTFYKVILNVSALKNEFFLLEVFTLILS
jgi:hypothetical protein